MLAVVVRPRDRVGHSQKWIIAQSAVVVQAGEGYLGGLETGALTQRAAVERTSIRNRVLAQLAAVEEMSVWNRILSQRGAAVERVGNWVLTLWTAVP